MLGTLSNYVDPLFYLDFIIMMFQRHNKLITQAPLT